MATSDIFNLTDTWNAGATTFTAIKMDVTDTASASASLLLDLQVGGASQFKVGKTGTVTFSNSVVFSISGGVDFATNSVFRSGAIAFGASSDAIIARAAAASLRLGAPDAAAPVAQTLGVQSVVAGTTNTAGTNFTIKGSAGTGTGAGGSIIFQVAPAGSSGTAQNAFSTALTIATTAITAQNHLLFSADNTYDIGASGATRPRNVFVAGDVTAAGAVVAGATQKFQVSGRLNYSAPAAGVARIETTSGTAAVLNIRSYTVANLPSAVTYSGSIALVSDATATTPRSTVAGGGANFVMVMSDGTNWLIVA
jgi:hypothetical protein